MKRSYIEARESIHHFYVTQHTQLTFDKCISLNNQFDESKKKYYTVSDLMCMADTIYDESDPDTSLSQTVHAYQSANKALENNEPLWMIASLLIHDLGKCIHKLCGIPMHFLVGDTYPLDVPPQRESIVFGESVLDLTDRGKRKGCGLMSLTFTGHDEMLWKALLQTEHTLPQQALYCIRFHSFYPYFDQGAYSEYTNDYDTHMLPILKKFNNYDLYSKDNQIITDAIRTDINNIVNMYLPHGIMLPCPH